MTMTQIMGCFRFMPRASTQKGKQAAAPEQEAGPSSPAAAERPSRAVPAAAGAEDRTLVILPDQQRQDADGEAAAPAGKGGNSGRGSCLS